MSVANGNPINTRAVRDINYIANIALPNAANTVNTNALNLVQATPYPVTERVICNVLTGAGNGANNKNINVVLQHTADNGNGSPDSANWANIPQFAAPILRVLDNANTTVNTGNVSVLLPPNVKQWIRAQATGEANGGNAANANLTIQLLF